MNDRQIISFLKIVDCGSFTKTAKENYISVAAIIEQIDRLEEDLNTSLFIRSSRGIKLTRDGEIFYESFLKMKNIYDDALIRVANKSNTINIGVAYSQYPKFLMDVCKIYIKKYDASLSFVESPYSEHLDALRNNKIDITIIARPKNDMLDGLTYKELGRDTYSFGMSDSHPLSNKEIINKDDLSNTTILCGTYDYMKYPFKDMLKGYGNLKIIDSEYTFNIRANAKFEDSILVFHSLWSNSYTSILKVVPSNIDAGGIGIVYRSIDEQRLDTLIKSFINYNY